MTESQNYTSLLYWIALILPSIIAGVVSIVSLITNYRSSKNSQLKNMVFAQKEKVADQFIEKSSELIALTDPLALNAKINEFTPTLVEHSEFMVVMQSLLNIDTHVQTLGSVIKLHTWSVYEENDLSVIAEMFDAVDNVQKLIQEMVLQLIQLHVSNTEKGHFTKPAPINDKLKLEREFSQKYAEPYVDMVEKITKVARILRRQAICVTKK